MKFARQEVFQVAAKYDPLRNPIIHAGAHHGEEKDEYNQMGYKTILWVEAQDSAFEVLKDKVGEKYCLKGGLWDVSNVDIDMHVTGNSVSSSFYQLNPKHDLYSTIQEVDLIKVKTINLVDAVEIFKKRKVLERRFVLRLDVQGSEYRILKASTGIFDRIDFVCCEVTGRHQIYEGTNSRRKIIFLFLAKFWIPAFSRINPETSHGETIFIPLRRIRTFYKPIIYMRVISFIDIVRFRARAIYLLMGRCN